MSSKVFEPGSYGPVIGSLLSEVRVPPLGPGRPNVSVRDTLRSSTSDALFAHTRLVDRSMADACRSGLWLYHDFLDESHTISQGIETPSGSFWHGIMHRREPDFSNAGYWFRRVGAHPVFPDLCRSVREAATARETPGPARDLARASRWDAMGFIELCAALYEAPEADQAFCRRVCLLEWQHLFDYCYQTATAQPRS